MRAAWAPWSCGGWATDAGKKLWWQQSSAGMTTLSNFKKVTRATPTPPPTYLGLSDCDARRQRYSLAKCCCCVLIIDEQLAQVVQAMNSTQELQWVNAWVMTDCFLQVHVSKDAHSIANYLLQTNEITAAAECKQHMNYVQSGYSQFIHHEQELEGQSTK